MSVGRNEPCPCRSGKKFKACCAGKGARQQSKGLMLLLGAIGLVVALGLIGAATANRETPAEPIEASAAPASTPGKQPPGAAPAGKVWSEEHGHWHNAAPSGTASPIRMTPPALPPAAPATLTPQPAGKPPAGKVWSAEHGHWHDKE